MFRLTLMSRKIALSLILSVLVLISSCLKDSKQTKSTKNLLYTSGGRTSEVLIVISNDLWKTSLGDTLIYSLQSVPLWLSRAEPEYEISHIPLSSFGAVYQKQRNIMIFKKAELKEPKIEVRHNLFSTPQTVITIKANSVQGFTDTYLKYQNQIKEFFHKNEVNRIAKAYKNIDLKSISGKLEKQFGFSLSFPEGFYIADQKANFAWIRRPAGDIEEGVFIFIKPYTDTASFGMQAIINYRNEMTSKFVPGPVKGSYMKVSDYFPPLKRMVDFKGNYASQLRSFWDVEGYPMGGPFISYTFVDTIANRLITLDGYIKAPKEEKRDLILHLEALLVSFQFQQNKIDKVEKIQ